MRNKPWALDYLKSSPVVVFSPEEYKGNWKKHLDTDFLRVEIGAGKGDYWSKMSALNPTEGWIAVEKEKNVAAIAAKKVEELPISKLSLIVGDASNIEEWFEEGEVDIIHLNFSDPWPKRRNQKRRLTHFSFLERYGKILSEDGCIIMKTDQASLFEFSLLQFSNENWLIEEVSLDFRKTAQTDVMTEYEKTFVEAGLPIYRGVFRKRKEHDETY